MATSPDLPASRLRPVDLAKTHVQNGRRHEAYKVCRALLAQDAAPDIAWGRLSEICYALGDVDGAVLALRRFLDVHPKDLAARGHLAEYLGETGQVDEAISIAGQLLHELEKMGARPAGLLRGLGYFYAQKGDFERAQQYYRAALKTAPAETFSWEQLSAIKHFEPGDPDVQTMEAQFNGAAKTASPKDRTHLAYALGKAYEDLGQADKAFFCVAEGARLAAMQTPFDVEDYKAAIADIRANFAHPPAVEIRKGEGETLCPIFILGVPRSGTTLVEQILASHPDVCGGGEMKLFHLAMAPLGTVPGPQTDDFLNDDDKTRPGEELRKTIAKTYRDLVRQRFGDIAFVTDKNLTNAIYAGVIVRALPEAKFIYCRRDPVDLAWSCFKKNFGARLGWSNDLVDIAHFIHSYEQLMAFWCQQMPSRILGIAYEDLVENPGTWTDTMLDFCGLTKNDACYQPHASRRPVATNSVAQVRRPIYKTAIGSASAYRPHLQPFLDAYTGLCDKTGTKHI